MLSSTKEREKVVHGGARGPGLGYMMPIVCAKAWLSLTKPAAGKAGRRSRASSLKTIGAGVCLWVILLAACLAVLVRTLSILLLLALRRLLTLNRPWV